MQIKLNKCEEMEDWYTILRAKHDGREWYEKIEHNISRFMCSKRLVPDACIEGTGAEMRSLANAIKNRSTADFKRCAVRFEADGVHFYSPKNSSEDGVVTIEEADEFAAQVFAEIVVENRIK